MRPLPCDCNQQLRRAPAPWLLTVTVPTVAQITNLPATASCRFRAAQRSANTAVTPHHNAITAPLTAHQRGRPGHRAPTRGGRLFNQTVSGFPPTPLLFHCTGRELSAPPAAPSRSFTSPPAPAAAARAQYHAGHAADFLLWLHATNAGSSTSLTPSASPVRPVIHRLVVERGGTAAVITNLANPTALCFDISSKVPPLERCGLLSIVFHPGYVSNGFSSCGITA